MSEATYFVVAGHLCLDLMPTLSGGWLYGRGFF
jgi:hypothetical protein